MPYIEIYPEDATDEQISEALENFMENSNYFEASSWQIQRLSDGTFKETCCPHHAPHFYKNLKDWENHTNVYPDQYQWIAEKKSGD